MLSVDVDEEAGAILPMMAIVLILLMGAAAMAVDLGWVFWNSIEVQHGADAAALAGVVYEPDDQTRAYAEARQAAAANGLVDGADGTTVTVIDFRDDADDELKENMLRVNVTHAVPTFFLTLFGIDTLDVTRTAVAEYLQPLALGSPESYFGDDPARGSSPGFWAQINGHYVAKIGGDRFAAQCLDSGFGSGCTPNPEARPVSGWGTESAKGGYLFGIEVEEGSDLGLTVEIFNGAVYAIPKRDDGTADCDSCPIDPWGNPITGNFAGDIKKESGVNVQARTWFMLYGPDLTPLDTTDGNELLCSIYYDQRINSSDETNPPISDAYLADFGDLGWDVGWLEFDQVPPVILDAMWDDIASPDIADFASSDCSNSFDRGAGIYVLRVFNEPTSNGRGANKFSIRVGSSGPVPPSIYGIGDMVMSSTRNTTRTEFHLARVEQQYAGKDLILELWDVGDIEGGDDNAWFRIVDGSGDTVVCDWVATSTTSPSNPTSGSGTCSINASSRRFDNELITMTVAIPEDYTCSGDGCWWRIIYDIAGQVKETTTWSAYVAGNPIHLVE